MTGQWCLGNPIESVEYRYEERLVIDPASGAPLSREIWTVQPDGSTELANYTLVIDTGFTDEAPPTG